MSSKTRDLVRPITKISNNHDEKYMKIKFNSDDELPLNKMIEIPSIKIAVKAITPVFYENNKYHLHISLDECFYKFWTCRLGRTTKKQKLFQKNMHHVIMEDIMQFMIKLDISYLKKWSYR